jgi:WD40 repeat protein
MITVAQHGRQYILEVGEDGIIREVRNFLTQEVRRQPPPWLAPNLLVVTPPSMLCQGLYDCSWSEVNEAQLVSASADGSVKLWDITTSGLR